MNFEERLKEYRLSRGLTQKQVADALGVGFSTYSNYELGRREPNLKNLVGLSSVLDVSLDVLLETEFMPNAPRVRNACSDADLKQCLWGDRAGITRDMIDLVREYATFLADKQNRKE